MRALPYVGVSGVVSVDQASRVLGAFARSGLPASRQLLLGVKATHKTQWLGVGNRYGSEWFPVGESGFASAAPVPSPGVMGVAQVFLEPSVVADAGYREAFTQRLLERGRSWLTGVQFDMLPWHTEPWAAGYLAGLRECGLDVLVQCHGPAMAELGPVGCARRLAEVGEGISHVLFDSSHGTGRSMDSVALGAFVAEALSVAGLDHVGLAVAGGLDAVAVREGLPSLLELCPDLSWDAEGRLHPEVLGSVERPLDLGVVGGYFEASAFVLGVAA